VRANALWLLVLLVVVAAVVAFSRTGGDEEPGGDVAVEEPGEDPGVDADAGADPEVTDDPEADGQIDADGDVEPDPEAEGGSGAGTDFDQDGAPAPDLTAAPTVSAVRTALPGQQIGVQGEDLPPGVATRVVLGPEGTADLALTGVGEATADVDGEVMAQVRMPMEPGVYLVGLRWEDPQFGPQVTTTLVRVEGPGSALGPPPRTTPPPARTPVVVTTPPPPATVSRVPETVDRAGGGGTAP
jgi:hypothetical protein